MSSRASKNCFTVCMEIDSERERERELCASVLSSLAARSLSRTVAERTRKSVRFALRSKLRPTKQPSGEEQCRAQQNKTKLALAHIDNRASKTKQQKLSCASNENINTFLLHTKRLVTLLVARARARLSSCRLLRQAQSYTCCILNHTRMTRANEVD